MNKQHGLNLNFKWEGKVMKVLIEADSFKGSDSSKQVAAYLAAGIREALEDVVVR